MVNFLSSSSVTSVRSSFSLRVSLTPVRHSLLRSYTRHEVRHEPSDEVRDRWYGGKESPTGVNWNGIT